MTIAAWRRELPKDQQVRLHHFRDFDGRIVATLAHIDLNPTDAVYAFAFAPETVEKPIRIDSTIVAEAHGLRVERNVYALARAAAPCRPAIMREVASGRAQRWFLIQKKFDDVRTDIKEFARGNPSGDIAKRLTYSGVATKAQLKDLVQQIRFEQKKHHETEAACRPARVKRVDPFRSYHVQSVWKKWKLSERRPHPAEKAPAPTTEARA